MSKIYSAHPQLALDQLLYAERIASGSKCGHAINCNNHGGSHGQHRRHNSISGKVANKTMVKGTEDSKTVATQSQHETTALPDSRLSWGLESRDEVDNEHTRRRKLSVVRMETATNTKDCSNTIKTVCLQQHFSSSATLNSNIHQTVENPFYSDALPCGGLSIEMSSNSALSTPSASTVSSPLSTPTRLSPLKSVRRQVRPKSKLNVRTAADGAVSTQSENDSSITSSLSSPITAPSLASQQQQQQHHHQMQEHYQQPQQQLQNEHHNNAPNPLILQSGAGTNGSTNLEKRDPRYGASTYRLLFPIVVCILAVTTVFSILVVYMDTTEIHHQQFRLNMSRPYELYGVAQDDPNLIAFLQQIHIPKYSMHFLKSTTVNGGSGGYSESPAFSSSRLLGTYPYFNFSAQSNELLPKMAHYVANLLEGKTNGAVFQSLTGTLGHLMTAPWLVETLNWAALIVEPDPQRYFALDNQNALWPRVRVVHACVSPNSYPKEITVPNEESEVRINSVQESETSWFYSRVKCFPLYSIMLATNRVEYDLLSLGVPGHELEILQTLPFDKVNISVISIHLLDDQEDISRYENALNKFLLAKSYKLQKKFGLNLFYQHSPLINVNSNQRTLNKDIVPLKTP